MIHQVVFKLFLVVLSVPSYSFFIEKEYEEAAHALKREWERIYAVQKTDETSANFSLLDANCGRPSHLENCTSLQQAREHDERPLPQIDLLQAQESNSTNQGVPKWRLKFERKKFPTVPWVVGDDDSNFPKTKQAQADIWLNQFQTDCAEGNVSFLLTKWPDFEEFDAAGLLHFMSARLSQAMASKRVLVILPGTFKPAVHSDCAGALHGSFSCFFFPLTSAECESRAMELFTTESPPEGDVTALSSPAKLVVLQNKESVPELEAEAARLWGEPWLGLEPSVEQWDSSPSMQNATSKQVTWWRAQSVRFFLRWPSQRMCRLLNHIRNHKYGLHVAGRQVKSCRALLSRESLEEDERNLLANRDLRESYLEKAFWVKNGPFVPRPILSLHLGAASALPQAMAAYLWHGEKIRWSNPSLRFLWLTADSLAEDAARRFASGDDTWQCLHTLDMVQEKAPLKELAELQLVNLLMASQADYFIGDLSSHFGRVVNELRSTNGRLHRRFVAFGSQ